MESMVEKQVEVESPSVPKMSKEYVPSMYTSDSEFARYVADNYEAGDDIKVMFTGKVTSVSRNEVSTEAGGKKERISVNLEFKKGECVHGKEYASVAKAMGEE